MICYAVYVYVMPWSLCIWVGVYFPSYILSKTYLFLPNRCRWDVILRAVGTTTMRCQLTCSSCSKDKPSWSCWSRRTWETTTTIHHHHHPRLWTRLLGSWGWIRRGSPAPLNLLWLMIGFAQLAGIWRLLAVLRLREWGFPHTCWRVLPQHGGTTIWWLIPLTPSPRSSFRLLFESHMCLRAPWAWRRRISAVCIREAVQWPSMLRSSTSLLDMLQMMSGMMQQGRKVLGGAEWWAGSPVDSGYFC